MIGEDHEGKVKFDYNIVETSNCFDFEIREVANQNKALEFLVQNSVHSVHYQKIFVRLL